jgi:7-cyano-7-deazaguanine tRNA-ribosyltransferase
MAFEIKEKDLLGRIGRLKTKSGTVETPLLFPVINPVAQVVSPRRVGEEFGFEAVITNAYILKQRFSDKPIREGVHRFLDFDGVVMTDSGAYQILVYGGIEASQKEIVRYQEQVGSDVATILDIPTGWRVTEEYARGTVEETLKRAREFFKLKSRDDVLWVGPVQGGKYLNFVEWSAREMGKLPFEVYALGSPTEVMERYRFDVLVDMVLAAKMNLPVDRPLHLFGAGHPFMFGLAVALGCDFFDSAAYALYAKEDRYLTESGTFRLSEMEYFPCQCPKCARATPKRVLELPVEERVAFLAEHNLYVCAAELRRVKQAVRDGRLWELLEMRSRGHPMLLQALKRLSKYSEFVERFSPAVKDSGLFFFDSVGLARPEVVRYRRRLAERYVKPREAKTLVLVPQTVSKPFHKSHEYKRIKKLLKSDFGAELSGVHVCFYCAPFGVVPIELDEIYPLSQHETAMPLDKETKEYAAEQVAEYVKRANYERVMLFDDAENWDKTVLNALKKTCRQKHVQLTTKRAFY